MWHRRRDPPGRRARRRGSDRPDDRGPARPRPGRLGDLGARRRRAGPPAAVDRRPLRERRAADGRPAPRAGARLQRDDLQLPRAARRARGARLRASPRRRTPRCCSRRTTAGAPGSSSGCAGCSPSRSCEVESGRVRARPRPARDQAALPRRGRPAGSAFASSLPALLAAGGVDTAIDPVALHHYLSWHAIVPAAADDPARRAQGPAGDAADDRARRPAARGPATGRRRSSARRRTAAPEEWAEAVRECLRVAVRRRMVADVPVGVLLSGGLDSSLIVALLAEEGQTGLRDVLDRVRGRGGQPGDEFEHSDLVAARVRRPSTRRSSSRPRSSRRLRGAPSVR